MSLAHRKCRVPIWALMTAALAAAATSCTFDRGPKNGLDDDVVAVVNDLPVTIGDVEERFQRLETDSEKRLTRNEENAGRLKRAIVQELIHQRLLVGEARARGLAITEDEIDREMERFWPLEAEEKEGSIPGARGEEVSRLRTLVEDELLMLKLLNQISEGIQVETDEIKAYYEANTRKFFQRESVRARQVVLSSKEEADEVRKRLLAGEDLARTASEVSVSPDGALGGDMGFFERGQMPKELEDAAFSLSLGKLSRVVETRYGFHILMVEEKRKERQLGLDEVEETIAAIIRGQKSEERYSALLKDLLEQARITFNKKHGEIIPLSAP